jgi:hypothetical protein
MESLIITGILKYCENNYYNAIDIEFMLAYIHVDTLVASNDY